MRIGYCLTIWLVLTVGVAAHQAAARPFDDHPKLRDLPDRWAALMDDLYVPGAAVAVIDGGEVYMETFGYRDAAQTKPVDADTMFYIGSITKTYTTAALMRLARSGEISLDDKVVDLIPGFELADKDAQGKIRVRDLLTHRYGIDTSIADVRLEAYTGEYTQERFLYFISRALVRGETRYANAHFEIAGRVIEAVTGMDWREYLEQALLAPAGLTRTTGYASELWRDENAADPLLPTETGYRLPDHLKTDRTMHPAGGLGASLRDAVRFVQLHLNGGQLDGRRLLPRENVDEAFRLQARYPEAEGNNLVEIGRTLGWEFGEWAGSTPVVYHGGGYSGATARYLVLPEQKAGFVVMVNSDVPAFAWRSLVESDLLARLSGTGREEDYYNRVTGWIAAGEIDPRTPIGPAAPPEAIAAMNADSLSGPIGLYAGYFHNENFGTLIVEECDESLCFHLGDAPIPVKSDGTDAFRITGFIRSTGRFIVGPGGEINSILIQPDGESFEPQTFTR